QAQGKLVAHLSDSSSPDFVDTSVGTGSGSVVGLYTLNYQALNPNQTLTITYTQNNPGANVTLQSAALSSFASDFTMSATPGTQPAPPGGSTTYSVGVSAVNGFVGTVSFDVTGLPTGATASFNPTTVNGSGSSTLTVNLNGTVASGGYPLTITATS